MNARTYRLGLLTLAFLGIVPGLATANPSAVFALDSEQADRVLYETMAAEFPSEHLVRVHTPYPGYRVVVRFAVQGYTVIAQRIPYPAQAYDRFSVQGYRFEVNLSGNIPRGAQDRAAEIIRHMELRAGRIAAIVPSGPGRDVQLAGASPENGMLGAVLQTVPAWLVPLVLVLGVALGMVMGSAGRRMPSPRVGSARGSANGPHAGPANDSLDLPLSQDRDVWSVPVELLELTHDAVIIWEMEGAGILYWNRSAEHLYGYSREEAQGRVTHELLHTSVSESVSELEAKLARYGVWVGELHHRTRDGGQVTVEARLALLAQRNGRWLVLEVNRDVSDHAVLAERSSAVDRVSRQRASE